MQNITQGLSSNMAGPGTVIRDGHDNFFTPMRIVFALLVMIGHASIIATRDLASEPSVFFDYSFSYLAVNMFFIASGFLVTKSMLYRGDQASFTSARLLRIYPALIVHVLFVMLIVGPIATTLPLGEFLSQPEFYLQPVYVLTFLNTGMTMPGVFTANAEAFGSAPLWTLRFEMLCYIMTLLTFSLGLMRRKWMVLAQFIVPAIIWVSAQTFGYLDDLPGTAVNMLRFGIAYGLGATIYAYRDRISFDWTGLALTLAICWLAQSSAAMEVAVNLCLAWIVMAVAYVRMPKLSGLQTVDDISYGIYIYHWVVMQLLSSWMPSIAPVELFLMALPVTVSLAWLSWTYVEKPILRHKTALGRWLRFGRTPRSYSSTAVLLD